MTAVFDLYVHNPKTDKDFWLKVWIIFQCCKEQGFKKAKYFDRKAR